MSLLNPMDDDQLDAIIQGLERVRELEAEVARLRLTDAERKALSQIYDYLNERSHALQAARRIEESTPFVQLAKTVQVMWERLQ